MNDLDIVNHNGRKEWRKGGKLHRDGDLPAIECSTGYKEWWDNGKLHRDGDLPAIESSNGDKWWYKNGVLHRDGDLPAVEWGWDREWWKNGKRVTFEYCKAIEKIRKFRNRIKIISSIFNTTPHGFNKLLKFIKTREFNEWWYSPDNYGGRRHKRIMSEWFNNFKNQRMISLMRNF